MTKIFSAIATMNNPHQRVGSPNNTHVGDSFEKTALLFFENQGLHLSRNFSLNIGVSNKMKEHCFDLGSDSSKIIVECKSHRWTAGDKVPSAKMATWNEAMLYFLLVPEDFRKIFFTLHDKRKTTQETLVTYYKRTYFHLIPEDVEFFEFDESTGDIIRE
jgi:hypothetical protein